MKLSQLFTGKTHMEETGRGGRIQQPAHADINRQIRSLVPGQTIRGEVISRNGGEIQIRLAEDMLLNARVDQSIYLETGKSVTFEVRNNGSTLSLSPLYTNVAADATVLKALDMAGLPVNETTVSMTEQLMEAGLPVNRSSLQQVYREINSFPENEISDVIHLHRLQLPVNETNMQQMAAYRNLNYQLINSVNDLLSALPAAADSMLAEENIQGAVGLYRQLFSLVKEGEVSPADIQPETLRQVIAGETPETVPDAEIFSEAGESGMPEIGEKDGEAGDSGKSGTIDSNAAERTGESGSAGYAAKSGTADASRYGGTVISAEVRSALTHDMLQTLEELQLSSQEKGEFAEQIQRFGQGEMSAAELFDMTQKLLESAAYTEKGMETLQKMFSGKAFGTVLTEQLKTQWTLQPEEVSQPGKVEELYRRLDRQLKGLAHALESGGQEGSTAYRAVTNISQNVDFLNQINQMYTYVQLPLHLQHSDAHGDLYVYANKRSLAKNDGMVSALLHLDMEHLGPVDVYVTLQERKVNTQFYVADDEILDFIQAHMDMLTERLQKRGYSCSFSMAAREAGEKESAGGLAPLLQQEKGILLSQYAFDVRT